MRGARAAALLACAFAHSACDFTAFTAYGPRAQIAAYPAPDGYRGQTFGSTLATVPSPDGRGFFVVSSGSGTAVAVYGADLARATTDVPQPLAYACATGAPCAGLRIGDPIAGVARWAGSSACALVTAFGEADTSVRVVCVGAASVSRASVAAPSPEAFAAGFAQSLVGTPDPEGGLFFAGAPTGARVYALRDDGASAPIALSAGPAGFESRFGDALAVRRARVDAVGAATQRTLWLFAGAPGAGAAYAMRQDPSDPMRFTARGCAPGRGGSGFGGVLAAGDFDGDGLADVAVSAKRGIPDRANTVRVFLGARLPDVGAGEPSCEGSPWPGIDLECGADDGVRCEGSDFGASLAAADLDGDGRDELLVGMPGATVDGSARAGAVFVAPFTAAGGRTARGVYLRAAGPSEGEEVGAAVSAMRVGGRDEPLVGSSSGVRVFACSGLDADKPNAPGLDERCQPRG